MADDTLVNAFLAFLDAYTGRKKKVIEEEEEVYPDGSAFPVEKTSFITTATHHG